MLTRLIVMLSLLGCLSPCYAGMRISDFSSGGTTITFNNWSGPGPATVDVDFCVTSVQGQARNSNTPLPYEIKVRDRASANAAFELSARSGSGETLPLTINYTDLYTTQSEQLSTNTYTTQDKSGGLFQCPSGLNARLQFVINANDLAAVSAGDYRARLRIVARGGNNGTQRRRSNITLNLTIDDAVQLSGLDDILFGQYIGSGNLNANEDFCVYRNGTGSYQVTAFGSGIGAAFAMQSGSNQIPFTVSWNDGGTNTPLTANSAVGGQQNAFAGSVDCNGGANNNASIDIQIDEAVLGPAIAGNYQGTLTLIIAPE